MTDKYARERIEALEKELREVKWELKHKIYALQRFLNVEEQSVPAEVVLVPKKKGA